MALDDKAEIEIAQYRKDSDVGVTEVILKSAVRSGIAAIPVVGNSINEIFSGLAQRRAENRIGVVFAAMKERLDEIDEEKIDKCFFESEEFQTVLLLVLENIHTTHNAEKLKVLGYALANAGTIDLRGADKENFARILRDLTPGDFVVLNDALLKGWTPHIHPIQYPPDALTSLYRLQAMGLVHEHLKPKEGSFGRTGYSESDTVRALSDLITSPPQRTFSLSSFGEKFLQFVAAKNSPERNGEAKKP